MLEKLQMPRFKTATEGSSILSWHGMGYDKVTDLLSKFICMLTRNENQQFVMVRI
jgi:hypothetical protein